MALVPNFSCPDLPTSPARGAEKGFAGFIPSPPQNSPQLTQMGAAVRSAIRKLFVPGDVQTSDQCCQPEGLNGHDIRKGTGGVILRRDESIRAPCETQKPFQQAV